MKNFRSAGLNVNFIATAALTSGELFIKGSLPMVSTGAFAVGDEGVAVTEGVFEVPKVAADAPSQFDKAYFHAATKSATVDPDGGNNKLVGVFMNDYANGDTLCEIKLTGAAIA